MDKIVRAHQLPVRKDLRTRDKKRTAKGATKCAWKKQIVMSLVDEDMLAFYSSYCISNFFMCRD